MITQENIDKAISGISAFTGQDEPDSVYVVMDFDGFIATLAAVGGGGEGSADMRACLALLSSMTDEELMQVRNEADHLLNEMKWPGEDE